MEIPILKDIPFQNDFPVTVVPIQKQNAVALHRHHPTELVLILEGRGWHITEIEHYEIEAGDVFVIHPGDAHGYQETHNLSLINVLFDCQYFNLPFRDQANLSGYHALFTVEPSLRQHHGKSPRLHIQGETLHEAKQLAMRLYYEIRHCEPGYQSIAFALLIQLISLLSRAYQEMNGKKWERTLYLGELLSYIDEHLTEPMSLSTFCKVAHMSESSLLRYFRRLTGMTPIHYVNYRRIQYGADLLLRTYYSIEEIAHQTGIKDANYFSRLFRHYFQCSPSVYRKKHQSYSSVNSLLIPPPLSKCDVEKGAFL